MRGWVLNFRILNVCLADADPDVGKQWPIATNLVTPTQNFALKGDPIGMVIHYSYYK
jgi:hypothetical protein